MQALNCELIKSAYRIPFTLIIELVEQALREKIVLNVLDFSIFEFRSEPRSIHTQILKTVIEDFSVCEWVFLPVTRSVKGYTRFVGKYVTGRRKRGRVDLGMSVCPYER